jgi:hypothetical protein
MGSVSVGCANPADNPFEGYFTKTVLFDLQIFSQISQFEPRKSRSTFAAQFIDWRVGSSICLVATSNSALPPAAAL